MLDFSSTLCHRSPMLHGHALSHPRYSLEVVLLCNTLFVRETRALTTGPCFIDSGMQLASHAALHCLITPERCTTATRPCIVASTTQPVSSAALQYLVCLAPRAMAMRPCFTDSCMQLARHAALHCLICFGTLCHGYAAMQCRMLDTACRRCCSAILCFSGTTCLGHVIVQH